MSNVIPFNAPQIKEPECSFCKRPESQVKKPVGNGQDGANARYICSDCVAKAGQRIKDAA